MNILKNTRTYLVGHIENAGSEAITWREKITIELNKLGIKVFNPFLKPFVNPVPEDESTKQFLIDCLHSGDFDKVHAHMKKIRAFDLRMVDMSDFIIAKIDPVKASWGSADEIFTALKARKPVFLAVDGGKEKTPLWLMGSMKQEFIYNTVDEILYQIKEIDSGNIELDDKYWRLFLPEYR